MSGVAGQQGARLFRAQQVARQRGGGQDSWQAEARQQERPSWPVQGREDVGEEDFVLCHQRAEEALPGPGVTAKVRRRGAQRALQGQRASAIQGMGQRQGRLNPFEAVLRQWQGAQEGRGQRQGMHRRAEVVREAGQGQFGGTQAAANFRLRFVDAHLQPRLRQRNGGGQPVGAGADHDGVGSHGWLASSSSRLRWR